MATTTTARKAATTRSTSAKASATKPEAKQPEAKQPEDNVVLGAFRTTLKTVEGATLSFGAAPLALLQTVGVPESATSTIKGGTEQMVHGVTGSLDAIASGSFKVAGKGLSLLTGAVGALKP